MPSSYQIFGNGEVIVLLLDSGDWRATPAEFKLSQYAAIVELSLTQREPHRSNITGEALIGTDEYRISPYGSIQAHHLKKAGYTVVAQNSGITKLKVSPEQLADLAQAIARGELDDPNR